jgi:protein tyrosine phosphatase
MDASGKEARNKKSHKAEEEEKVVRGLESDAGLAPSRLRASTRGKVQFAYNADKTVVSLPLKLSRLKNGPWYELEDRFLKEYDCVREVSLKLLFGKLEKKKRLGRGTMEEAVFTVGPFSDSRVKLEKLDVERERDSSFYNASWIGKNFIAAAMPQSGAARESFWRMVWEYDVPTVVMLNEDSEGVRRHDDIQRYCPNVLNEWESYGMIQVLKREQLTVRNMSATIRKISLRMGEDNSEVKVVDHVQYRGWPDGGIPSDREDYKEFIEYLLNLSRKLREARDGPVLVHCNALFSSFFLFIFLFWLIVS